VEQKALRVHQSDEGHTESMFIAVMFEKINFQIQLEQMLILWAWLL
jgi:hypothetical protein